MTPGSTGMEHEGTAGLVGPSDERPAARIVDTAADTGVSAIEVIRVGVPRERTCEFAAGASV